jgi:GABA(A) receptor-associated protein
MVEKKFVFQYDKEKRIKEVETVKEKHPDCIAIIAEEKPGSKLFITKKKFIVSSNLSVGGFMFALRKRMNLEPEAALFIFINNNISPPTGSILGEIYTKHKDVDGFLKITFCEENVFG